MCGSLSFPRGRTTTKDRFWSFVVHHLLFTGRCYREALIPCICRTSPVEKSIALVVWSAPNADPSALCTRRTARAHPQGAATNRFSAKPIYLPSNATDEETLAPSHHRLSYRPEVSLVRPYRFTEALDTTSSRVQRNQLGTVEVVLQWTRQFDYGIIRVP